MTVLPALAFQPKHLVVLRAGDGQVALKLKQSPIFLDEFLPGQTNTLASQHRGDSHQRSERPVLQWSRLHRRHAGTVRRPSTAHLAGYGGVSLLQSNGTPALLDISRGFSARSMPPARSKTTVYKLDSSDEKLNPRGMVSDDADHYWGCGNAVATLYITIPRASGQPDGVLRHRKHP